jgi:type I restriction enzyme M protein
MPPNHNEIEKKLWDAADELRANSKLKSSEYSVPVLGLIFLRYADHKFAQAEKEFAAERSRRDASARRRQISKTDYQARGVMYLPEAARFANLLKLPGGANIGKAINDAMKAIEAENEELKGILPRTYTSFDNSLLVTLLKTFASIPMDIEGDVFGKIYEYFLGEFAKAEGSKGGEFFTPTSLVKLIIEVIEPFHGRIFDPACGSGGMFVQSARFVENHHKNPNAEIMVYGQEKTDETVRLCKMNLAVHGLSGDIREGNSYYEDIHNSVETSRGDVSTGRFDFVMANPPFNVDRVDKERIKDDARFPFGMPRADNANYVWIQIFQSALNKTGRSGFVMANSASDARGSELEIRKKLIEAGIVDVMIAVGPNMFYTVTLPCTLWFLEKGKAVEASRRDASPRREKVLFLDARHIFHQVDRAHRDFTPEQIEFLANIVRLYRGEELEGSKTLPDELPFSENQVANLQSAFRNQKYIDVPGFCKVSTIKEIEAQGWSLNPSRYVGVAERPSDDFDFKDKLEELNEELETLNAEAHKLEERIAENVAEVLK